MDYYWILEQRDGTKNYIPPEAVPIVKRRWENKLPINLDVGSIAPSQIVKFEKSDRPFTDQQLLEDVAQAFKEPIYNDDDSIQTTWVKTNVTRAKWDKHFSSIPGYRKLGDTGGLITIAFRVATHEVNRETTTPCTNDEIERLTTKQ